MELIFDRTIQDVQRWQALQQKGWAGMSANERTEWLSNMKGAYGAADMNRVESAVAALSERLRNMGYQHPALTVKTNWVATDTPTVSDFERYFGNVATLRELLPLPASTPATPTINKRLDFGLANDLEKILYDIELTANSITSAWYYAGDIYSGEV